MKQELKTFFCLQLRFWAEESVGSAAAWKHRGDPKLHQSPVQHPEPTQPGHRGQRDCSEALTQHAHFLSVPATEH